MRSPTGSQARGADGQFVAGRPPVSAFSSKRRETPDMCGSF